MQQTEKVALIPFFLASENLYCYSNCSIPGRIEQYIMTTYIIHIKGLGSSNKGELPAFSLVEIN